jgi:hypothetical protein
MTEIVFDLEINDPDSFLKNLKIVMFSKFDKVTISMTEIHFSVWLRKNPGHFHHLEVGGNQRSRSFEWEIDDPDSPGFWPKIAKC